MARVMPLSVYSLSLSLTLWALWCVTTAKEMGCKEVCREVVVNGLNLKGACEIVCPEGVEPVIDDFKESVDNVLTGKRKEPLSGTDFIQGHHKRQKLEDNYEVVQNSGKQQMFKREASGGHLVVNVGLDITNDGEYILRIKRSVSSSDDEDELKRAKQMAQNAAMLSFYGEMLQDVGEKLNAQSRALLRSIFEVPAPYHSKSNS